MSDPPILDLGCSAWTAICNVPSVGSSSQSRFSPSRQWLSSYPRWIRPARAARCLEPK